MITTRTKLTLSSEFLCAGDKLLFREGRTKGLGIVTATGFDKSKFPHCEVQEKDRDRDVGTKKGEKGAAKGDAKSTVKPPVKKEAAKT